MLGGGSRDQVSVHALAAVLVPPPGRPECRVYQHADVDDEGGGADPVLRWHANYRAD